MRLAALLVALIGCVAIIAIGIRFTKVLMATFLRGKFLDKARKESTVSGSKLDRVIARPPS